MSTGTFKFWPPDLDRKCLGEYLGKFLLGSNRSGCVLLVIVNDMRSLGVVSNMNKTKIKRRVIYLYTHAMMPVGLISALVLSKDLEYVCVPSLHILRRLDLTGPRSCKEGLASFGRLMLLSERVLHIRSNKTYRHVPSKNKFVYKREEFEMWFKYWIRA